MYLLDLGITLLESWDCLIVVRSESRAGLAIASTRACLQILVVPR